MCRAQASSRLPQVRRGAPKRPGAAGDLGSEVAREEPKSGAPPARSSPRQAEMSLRSTSTRPGEFRCAAFGCSRLLPVPPSGARLDSDRVDIQYPPAGGAAPLCFAYAPRAARGPRNRRWRNRGRARAKKRRSNCSRRAMRSLERTRRMAGRRLEAPRRMPAGFSMALLEVFQTTQEDEYVLRNRFEMRLDDTPLALPCTSPLFPRSAGESFHWSGRRAGDLGCMRRAERPRRRQWRCWQQPRCRWQRRRRCWQQARCRWQRRRRCWQQPRCR